MPSYLRIAQDGSDTALKIASISISYSCSVSVNPYVDSGTEGLVYELNGDSTAYSVTGYTGQATAVHIPALTMTSR